MDEARGTPARSIDRRTLVRRAAGAGIVAWTAPVVVGSLASPAAAATPVPCSGIQYISDSSNNTETSTLTITAPASVQSGDLLIAAIHIESNTSFLGATNVTWNTLPDQNDGGGNNGMRVHWRVATGSEPASYTWATGGKKASGGIIALRCTSTSPIDAFLGSTGTSGNMVAPSVTTSGTNRMLLAFFGSKLSAGVHSQPPGMTQQYVTADVDFQSSGNTQLIAAAGGTGSRNGGSSGNDRWVAYSVAIAPA